MARATCQRSASHQGVWKCSCEAGGDFCSSCILSHMSVQAEGSAHSVSPIAPPVGQHTCARCHGQSIDSVFFNCEVCLCGDCTRELSAPAEAPGTPPELDEEHKAPFAEGPYAPPNVLSRPDSPVAVDREDAAAQGASTLLQRCFRDRKEGIRNSLRSALTEMERLEELVGLAAEMEAELVERRREVLREERRGRVGDNEDLQQIVQRMVTRENALLSAELQSLKQEHQDLKQQYQQVIVKAEEGLQEALKKELNAATERLQQSMSDQVEETARVAATKVRDVMPLVSQMNLENSWLDSRSFEEFFNLAFLSIGGLVSPTEMCQVTRSCVRLAKYLGPNPLMANFAASVSKRIKNSKASGMDFLSEFYGVYELVKEEKGKEVLSALLELLGKEDLITQAMEIINHLRKLIKVQCLSDFTIAASAYFQQRDSKPREWRGRLLKLPLEWENRHLSRAEECITGFLHAVRESHFSDGYLQLSKLLRKRNDPESLFDLVENLTKLMKIDRIGQELQHLVKKLLKLFNTDAKLQIETAFGMLKHLLIATEKENIKLLAKCTYKLYSRGAICSLVAALVRVLAMLSDKRKVPELGFAVLKWALGTQDEGVAFAEQMMLALEADQATLDETAARVAGLLAGTPHFVLSLLTRKVSVSEVCEFTVALLKDPQTASAHESFLSVLSEVACSAGPQKAEEWMQLTKLIVKPNFEAAVQTYQVYSAFGKRQTLDEEMAELGIYVLKVFRSSANDLLKDLLATVEDALNKDDLDCTVLQELLDLWRSYHQLLQEDPRSYEAISYLIKEMASSEVGELVTRLKDTVEGNERKYASAAMALVKVCMLRDRSQSTQAFLIAALDVLKGQTEDQRTSFEELIAAAVRELQAQTFNLLESIFRLKTTIFDQLFQLFTVKRPAVVDAFRVLKHLLRDNDASELQHLADAIIEIRNSDAVATLVAELVKVLEKLTQQEVISQLGFAVLKCALRKEDWSVEFAGKLLKALELDSPALGESSVHVARVLSSAPKFQSGTRALVERAVPTSAVCQFASALLGDLNSPEQAKLILRVLHDVTTFDSARVLIWMQLTQNIMLTRNHGLVRAYEMCSEFARRGVQVDKVVELGQFTLEVLQTEVSEPLRELQETVESVLGSDGLQCSLLFRAMSLWADYYKLLSGDQRACRLACFFADNLEKPEIPTQLEAFEAIVETNAVYAAAALTLAEVFMPTYAAEPESGQSFLAAALDTLYRTYACGKTRNLEELACAAVQFAQGEEQAASLLELVFRRSAEVTDRLLEFFDGEQPTPIFAAFGTLKHLLRDSEGQELQLLAASIELIKANEGIKYLAEILATVMDALKEKKDVISTLGFSVLRWTCEHPGYVEFAQCLVTSLDDPQTLEVASMHVAKVFASTLEFQASIQKLISSNIPPSIVCEFGSALLEDLQPWWEFVMNALYAVVKFSDQQEVIEWMRLTKVVMKANNAVTAQFYEMFGTLVNGVQSNEVVRLGKYLLNVIQLPVNLEPLKKLMGTVVRILIGKEVPYEVLLSVLMLLRKYHDLHTDDEQSYEILTNLVERAGSPEVSRLVTDLEGSTRDANYALNSLSLMKMYDSVYTSNFYTAQSFIAAALATLKRMRDDGERDNLKMLVDEAVRLQGPDKAALLLSRVFSLKDTVIDQLLITFAEKQARIGIVLYMLKYLLRDTKLEKDEAQLVEVAVAEVYNSDGIAELVTALNPVLEKLTEASKFGFDVLRWAFSCRDVEFALRVVRSLAPSSPTLAQSSRNVAKVLSSDLQAGVRALIYRNVPISDAYEFAVWILDDPQLAGRGDLFLDVLQLVATVNPEGPKQWLQLTKSVAKAKNEVVIKAYEACRAFWSRGHKTVEVVGLVQYLLSALKSAETSDSFKTLLNMLTQTLGTDGLKSEAVLKIMKLWRSSDRLMPNELATYLIGKVGRADMAKLATDFEEAVSNANGAYAAATFALAKVYMLAVAIDEERAKGFFTTALHVLKGLRDGSHRDNLKAFIDTTARDFPRDQLFLLEALFRPAAKGAEALNVGRLEQLLRLPATCQVVKSLSEAGQYEYCHALQSLLVPNAEVARAVSKLLDLAKHLFARGVRLPEARELERVVQQRPGDVVALVDPALLTMVGASPDQSHIAVRLLQELSRTNELRLLSFIATLATDLIRHVPQPHVSQLCTIFLDGFDSLKVPLQELMESWQQKLAGFVELLRRHGNAITLKDIYGFLYKLAHIQPTCVRTFDFQSKTWEQPVRLAGQIQVSESSSWVFLDSNQLFCCGGKDYAGYLPSSNAVNSVVAYLLTKQNTVWVPTRLQDMESSRCSHGTLYYAPKDLVYVFGGIEGRVHQTGGLPAGSSSLPVGRTVYSVDSAVMKCEKFLLAPQPPKQITEQPWETLREEMKQARSYFNPCLYRDWVYLCGVLLCGMGSAAMEVFSPNTEQFALLGLNHPDNQSCCLYVQGNLLVVHSNDFIVKYCLENQMLMKKEMKRADGTDKWQSTQPVVVGGLVYIMQCEECVSFDINTGRLGSVVK